MQSSGSMHTQIGTLIVATSGVPEPMRGENPGAVPEARNKQDRWFVALVGRLLGPDLPLDRRHRICPILEPDNHEAGSISRRRLSTERR